MPQLNPEFYVSQVFWLTVTFIFLLIFLWKVSLPRIKNALESRNNKISDNLQNAKKMQMDSEKIQKKIDDKLASINIETQTLIKQSIEDFKNDADKKIKILDRELKEKVDNAEETLQQAKKTVLLNIKNDVEQLTLLAVPKLTGVNLDRNLVKKEIDKINFNEKDLN